MLSITPNTGSGSPKAAKFDLLIGASSADIRHVETVTLESTVILKSLLDKESTVGEWLDDPRGRVVLNPLMVKLLEASQHLFGSGEEDEETVNRNIMMMVSGMPLVSVLLLQQELLEAPADQIVNALLRQVHDEEA